MSCRGGFTTKKVLAVILVIVIALSSAVSAFAASGINDAEVQVIKTMEKGGKIDPRFYQYANALKNYFNRDNVAITQVNADSACGLLLDYYDSYNPDDVNKEQKFFNTFQYVLMYLKVRLVYDRANRTANLIGGDDSLVMIQLNLENVDGARTVQLNPIKQTGPQLSTYLPLCITVSMVAALAGVLLIRHLQKKRKGKA